MHASEGDIYTRDCILQVCTTQQPSPAANNSPTQWLGLLRTGQKAGHGNHAPQELSLTYDYVTVTIHVTLMCWPVGPLLSGRELIGNTFKLYRNWLLMYLLILYFSIYISRHYFRYSILWCNQQYNYYTVVCYLSSTGAHSSGTTFTRRGSRSMTLMGRYMSIWSCLIPRTESKVVTILRTQLQK